ncbi:MAG: hypothetical protein ABIJ45_00195 [Candidatus Zixiibacteriota bacterium]
MKKILFPILIYVCFTALYAAISYFNNNQNLFLPVWDVEHYLTISERGYEVFPCTPGVNGYAGEICGNSGWFPMWPIVVAAIRPFLGGSSPTTFIALSFLFSLLTFIFIFRLIEYQSGFKAGIFCLLAMAANPSAFYWITGFPYALFGFLFASYLLVLYRTASIWRDIGLFAIGLALSLTYPTGPLVVVVPLVWYIYQNAGQQILINRTQYWLGLLKYIIPFILGPLLLALYFYIQFDDFFLQLHFQEKYHRTWAIPFWIMLKSLFTRSPLIPENIAILWYGLIFIIFYPYRLKKELAILAIVLYLFSLTTGSTMSIFRHYLIIIPAYMIIAVSTRPDWAKILYFLLGLAAALFIMFPRFLSYNLM